MVLVLCAAPCPGCQLRVGASGTAGGSPSTCLDWPGTGAGGTNVTAATQGTAFCDLHHSTV